MDKGVSRISLVSLVLLLCAAGSCYIGGRQYRYEGQQLESRMQANGFYISDTYPDMNIWQILGVLLFFAGVSVAIAALMFWRGGRKENG